MTYKTLLTKANTELKKVTDYIEKYDDMFDMMDLKLHDASYYCWQSMKEDFPLCCEDGEDYFSIFCNVEYEEFLDWCNKNYIDFEAMISRVGRTSKFYLHKWHDSDIDIMLYSIIESINGWDACQYYTIENGQIVNTDIEEYEEETIEDLTYIAEELFHDFLNAIEDMVKVYNYIKTFKEEQVTYFKAFLEGWEEQLRYEKEEEEREAIESHNICMEIKDRYGISNEDMDALQLNIMHY